MITMTPHRIAGALAALALALAGAAAVGAPAGAATGPTVRAACGAARPGHARCFALIRTDPGVAAAALRADLAASPPPGFGATALESAYSLPVSDGSGQTVALVKRQGQRKLRAIAEAQSARPVFFRKLREQAAVGRGELERRQGRFDVRRKFGRRIFQKSYLSANCMRRGLPAENALP